MPVNKQVLVVIEKVSVNICAIFSAVSIFAVVSTTAVSRRPSNEIVKKFTIFSIFTGLPTFLHVRRRHPRRHRRRLCAGVGLPFCRCTARLPCTP